MPDAKAPVPKYLRWIIALASMLVPRRQRAGWRVDWEAEIAVRWELAPDFRREHLRRVLTAFRDALVFQREAEGGGAFQFLRWLGRGFRDHPALGTLGVLALLLTPTVAMGVWDAVTGLVMGRLPYREPERLVSVRRLSPFLGEDVGYHPASFAALRAKTASFEELAAYRLGRTSLTWRNGKSERVEAALASPNLFRALGVTPALGRDFSGATRLPEVIIAHRCWRARFGGDSNVVGRLVVLGGVEQVVVGVLPADFWFGSRGAEVWARFDFTGVSGLRRQPPVFGVGRLKPGLSARAAEAELAGTLRRFRLNWLGAFLEVSPLRQDLLRVARWALWGPLMCLLAAALWAASGLARDLTARRPRPRLPEAARYWSFLFAKCAAGLTLVAAVWLYCADPSQTPGALFARVEWLAAWVFALPCAAVFRLAWLDQRSRCRACLRRLRMPVSLGAWSSPLIDRPATEYLCPAGHGALWVAESGVVAPQPDQWTALDSSWRDLFAKR